MTNRGYATLSLLILLPVILAALAVSASAYLLMRNDGDSRHLCRITLLESQEQAAEALKSLLALNPLAKNLRAQRKAAERAVQTAPDAITKAAALAALEVVLMEQTALAARQEGLLLRGRTASRAGPSKAQTSIKSLLAKAQSVQSEGTNILLGFQASIRPGQFDVVAEPKDSVTPDYKPSAFFSERQTMRVDWSFIVAALLPEWLGPSVNAQGLRSKATCSATIEKRGNKWETKLKADRS